MTAFQDNASEMEDRDLLDRASQLGRAIFTRDDDLIAEASLRQQDGRQFSGIIYAHQLRVSIGQCVNDLELIAKTGSMEEAANQVIFLPL